MSWFIRRLHVPASESQMALVLAFCSIAMSLMFWAIVWQARIIADQREAIHWLMGAVKLGG